jgi:hypothetical protein
MLIINLQQVYYSDTLGHGLKQKGFIRLLILIRLDTQAMLRADLSLSIALYNQKYKHVQKCSSPAYPSWTEYLTLFFWFN